MDECTICATHDDRNKFTQQEECAVLLTEKLLEHYRHVKNQLKNSYDENAKLKKELEASNVKLSIAEVDLEKYVFRVKRTKLEVSAKEETIDALQRQLKAVDQKYVEGLQLENEELKKKVERYKDISLLARDSEPSPRPVSPKRRKASSLEGDKLVTGGGDTPQNKSDSAVMNKTTDMGVVSDLDEDMFFQDSPPSKLTKPPFMPVDQPDIFSPIPIVTDLPKRKKLEFSSTKKKTELFEKPRWLSKLQLPSTSARAKATTKPASPIPMRQSLLNFSRSEDKASKIDDETFCEELNFLSAVKNPVKRTTPKEKAKRQTRLSIPSRRDSSDSESPFNFEKAPRKPKPLPQPKPVGKENVESPKKATPKKIKKEPEPVEKFIDDSSLMIIPNPDTEIISLDTQEADNDELLAILTDKNDRPPAKSTSPSKHTYGFLRSSPIRTNKEKRMQPGWDCEECRAYYENRYADFTSNQMQQVKNNCSRHRRQVDLHVTPDGFWNPCFTPTQDS